MENLVQPEKHLPALQSGLTKAEISAMAQKTVEEVMDNGNAASLAEAMAVMDEFIRVVRADDRFVQHLRDELWLHHGKMNTASGARIEACEAGVKYDFSSNPEWNAIDAEMEKLKARKRTIEETMKGLAPGRIVIDPETGEMTEGAWRQSKSTYKITLARGR